MIEVGAVKYANALPFSYAFDAKKLKMPFHLQKGSPIEVDTLLHEKKIDIGLISSVHFLENREQYILLTNFGLGATHSMPGVTLFSHYPIEQLDKKKVLVPVESKISHALLWVLAREFWQLSLEFIPYKEFSADLLQTADAVLAIGNDAIEHNSVKNCICIDLVNQWYQETSYPFVFSVFATRCDSWMQKPDEVALFHQILPQAFAIFSQNQDVAIATSGISSENVKKSIASIDYYLETEHFQGLEHFSRLCQKTAFLDTIHA